MVWKCCPLVELKRYWFISAHQFHFRLTIEQVGRPDAVTLAVHPKKNEFEPLMISDKRQNRVKSWPVMCFVFLAMHFLVAKDLQV